jgi:DNA replication and repair protein RecF
MGQVALQQTLKALPGVFLLDDLASELDADHQARLLSRLADLRTQVFVTAIDTKALNMEAWPVDKMFHVEHGEFQEVGSGIMTGFI